MKPPVVYAFVDGTNLNIAIREQGWKLHYKRFRRYLKDKHGVTKAFYFIGYMPNNLNLYESLRKDGYILKFKQVSYDKSGKIKGNIDAELVLTTILRYQYYDQAILVAGDGDYYCLAKYLKRRGKLSKIIIPDRYNYSWLLRKFVPNLVFMNGMRDKLEFFDKSYKKR